MEGHCAQARRAVSEHRLFETAASHSANYFYSHRASRHLPARWAMKNPDSSTEKSATKHGLPKIPPPYLFFFLCGRKIQGPKKRRHWGEYTPLNTRKPPPAARPQTLREGSANLLHFLQNWSLRSEAESRWSRFLERRKVPQSVHLSILSTLAKKSGLT